MEINVQFTRVSKMPKSLASQGNANGLKGTSVYQKMYSEIVSMQFGEVIQIGPFADAKRANAAQTSISHFMNESGWGYTSCVRNISGERLKPGDAAFLFVEKLEKPNHKKLGKRNAQPKLV